MEIVQIEEEPQVTREMEVYNLDKVYRHFRNRRNHLFSAERVSNLRSA